MGVLIFLSVIVLVSIFLWKKSTSISNGANENKELERLKSNIASESNKLFIQFHNGYKPSQVDMLVENTTEGFMSSIHHDLMRESDAKEIKIINLKSDVDTVQIINGVTTASVRYNGVREETDTSSGKVKQVLSIELWNFQLINNKWVISDIKTLAPMVEKEMPSVSISTNNLKQEKEIESSGKYNL